jgi:hypothetical protein
VDGSRSSRNREDAFPLDPATRIQPISNRERGLLEGQGDIQLVINAVEEPGPDGGLGRSEAPVEPCPGGVKGAKPWRGPGGNLLEPG